MVPHGLTEADLITACQLYQRDLDVAEIFSGKGTVAGAARRVGLKAVEFDISVFPESQTPRPCDDRRHLDKGWLPPSLHTCRSREGGRSRSLRSCLLVLAVVVHVADEATTKLQVRGRSAVQGRAGRKCYCRSCCGPLQTCTQQGRERYFGESRSQCHVQVRSIGRLFGRHTFALRSLPSLQIIHRPRRAAILEEVQVHVQWSLGRPAPCGLRLPSWTPHLSQNSKGRRPP